MVTTTSAAGAGFPDRLFHRDAAAERSRNFWLFLITIPFWTNLLVRTFAIMLLIRNEGLINTLLIAARRDRQADPACSTPTSPSCSACSMSTCR